jgi:CBS domain containing-hemolysin-like protein
MADIIITLLALVFSAMFSAYEIAFLSCNKLRLELDRKQGRRYAIVMDDFIKNPGKLISSLLMGNNVALVIYGIAIANLCNPLIQTYITHNIGVQLVIETLIATLIVLVTAEFLPKAFGRTNPNGVFKTLYLPILFFHYLLYPLTAAARSLSRLIIKISGIHNLEDSNDNSFDKTDLIHLANEMESTGVDEDDFQNDIDIFRNALNLSKIRLKECMIPRKEIAAIEVEEPVKELLDLFVESGYSRIMVYKASVDNIVGYVHSKDLFKCKKMKIADLLRNIDYVKEEMTAQNLLTFLTKNRKSVVVVRDEYGGTAGIVTLEDLIEEIFGDIGDELDKDEFVEKQVAEDEYVFSARLEIKELNRKYDLNLPDNDNYETLSGMITYHLENIPKERDVITIGNFVFTILKTDKNRIDKVLLKIT